MTTALMTFMFKGEVEKVVDLDISLSLSAGQCLEFLNSVHWLPDNWKFKCEVSDTGEEWKELELQVVLSEVVQGDGAMIKIFPY